MIHPICTVLLKAIRVEFPPRSAFLNSGGHRRQKNGFMFF